MLTSENSESTPVPTSNRGARLLLPWILVIASAALAAWFGARSLVARTEAELQRQQKALAELALKAAQQQLDAERIINGRQIASLMEQVKTGSDLARCKIALLRAPDPTAAAAVAIAVWDPIRQAGQLVWDNPPAIPENETLEIWLYGPDAAASPVNAGVLPRQTQAAASRMPFNARRPPLAVTAIAVSREKSDAGAPHAAPAQLLLRGVCQ